VGVPAALIHLVRHGEVDNPNGIIYGRIPGYGLSPLGRRMAAAATARLAGHSITKLYASPLQRTQESAAPWAERFGLDIHTDDRLVEPSNRFEGSRFEFGPQLILRPRTWPWITNPFTPSWGEPYQIIADRMFAAIDDAYASVEGGEVVMVSHQLSIVMVARTLAGRKLYHDPRKRRCNLSSITTLARSGDGFTEVNYQDPTAELLASAVDEGAV
jgi:broad specificity phosphatase PhoE